MMMVVVIITAAKCMSPHEPIIKSENWASQLELLSPCKSPPRKMMMMMMMTQFSTANFPVKKKNFSSDCEAFSRIPIFVSVSCVLAFRTLTGSTTFCVSPCFLRPYMESLTFLLLPFERLWSATVQSAPIIGTHLPSLSLSLCLSLSLQFHRPLFVFPRVQNQRSSFPSNPCATLGASRILSRKFDCRHLPPLCSWTIEELQIARRPDSDHCRLESPSPPRTLHSTKP